MTCPPGPPGPDDVAPRPGVPLAGVPPGPDYGLAGQPAEGLAGRLVEQGPEGEAPFADPVPGAGRVRAAGQAAAGEDEATADRAGEHVQQVIQPAEAGGRGRGGPQGQRQPSARVGAALGPQHPPGQARPGAQAGGPEIGDGGQVAGQPGPQVLPEQRLAGPGERVGGRGGTGAAGRLAQRGVQAEQGGQVVRLGGRRDPKSAPEPGGPVGGLAAEAALGAQVHRGVGRAVQHEHLGVLGVTRPGPAESRARRSRVGRVTGDGTQGAEQLPSPRRLKCRASGHGGIPLPPPGARRPRWPA